MLRKEVILIIKNLLKNSKKKIHISCSNKRFYNGIVLSLDDEDTLSFHDNVLGWYPIPYSLIINVELMRDKK